MFYPDYHVTTPHSLATMVRSESSRDEKWIRQILINNLVDKAGLGKNTQILAGILKEITDTAVEGLYHGYGRGVLLVTIFDDGYSRDDLNRLVFDVKDADEKSLQEWSLRYIGDVYLETSQGFDHLI